MATPLKDIRRHVRERLMEMYILVQPSAPLVAPQGTPGASTVTYLLVAKNSLGTSNAGLPTTITNSASTLNGTNFNQLTWNPVDGATSGFDIYRSATNGASPTTVGKIGSVAAGVLTFNDTGLAGDSSVASTDNTSGITNPFWSDAELLDYLVKGCQDLWRAIIDLHKGHFVKVEDGTGGFNPTQNAGDTFVSNVPTDCFRILSLEPRDLTQAGVARSILYKPKPYQSTEFQRDRSLQTLIVSYPEWVYFDILNPGSPVQAPSILISRKLDTAVPLRLVYVYTLPTLGESDNNPIPGESDNALVAWTLAYARAKEHPERMPDPAWLSVYATDKQSLLTALTPRQEVEEEVVEDIFAGAWGY